MVSNGTNLNFTPTPCDTLRGTASPPAVAAQLESHLQEAPDAYTTTKDQSGEHQDR